MFTPTRVQQQYEDSAVAEQPSTGRSCDRLRKEVKRCIKVLFQIKNIIGFILENLFYRLNKFYNKFF